MAQRGGGSLPLVISTTAAPRDAFVALPKSLASVLHDNVRRAGCRAAPAPAAPRGPPRGRARAPV